MVWADETRRLATLAAALCAICSAAPAVAQVAQSAPADTGALRARSELPAVCPERERRCLTLTAVAIEGATVFTPGDLAASYETYLTERISIDDLARVADAITARYRAEGYFLSRAIVPLQQDLDTGLAHIVIIEGRVAEIVIEGDGSALAWPFLRGLDTHAPTRLADLDRRLARASDVPGLRIRSRIEPDPNDPARHRLVIYAERKPVEWLATLDNRGTHDLGPWQLYARANLNSVLQERDQIGVGVFTSPGDPSEYTLFEAGYAYMFATGARVSASGSMSQAHDGFDPASTNIGGESRTASLQFDYPIVRLRRAGVWLGAAFDAAHFENDWTGGGGYADDSRVARIELRGFLSEEGRSTRFLAQASFGLDILGASGPSSIRRSRADADAEFAKVNLHLSHYRDLSAHFGVFASLDAQWSPDPLLISEEFLVGGAPYGRGYDYGEVSGDRGVAGQAELRAGFDPQLAAITFLQGYVFLEGGEIWNFNAPPGAESASLVSAGLGARIALFERLTLGIESARPLTRAPRRAGDKDWRQILSLTASY